MLAFVVRFFPAAAEGFVEALAEGQGHFAGLAFFVEGDGLADVIDDDLAGVAPGHVFLEFLAHGGVDRSVHVLVKHCE
jgi:hypothetical protein